MTSESFSPLTKELILWIEINSASDNPHGLAKMAEVLQSRLSSLPGDLERISLPSLQLTDGTRLHPGDALRFRFNTEAPIKVLFSGHMDTVYGVQHPFQKVDFPKPDILHGPGAADMKGGLLIMIEAVKRWLQLPESSSIGGEILITADEEVGSHGSLKLIEEAARWNDLGLVFESALPNGELVAARKGNGTFRIKAHGRSAHTGRDFQNGANALTALAGVVHTIHGWNDRFPNAIINVGRMQGGGPLNVVPDFAEAFLNIRVSNSTDIDEIKTALSNEMLSSSERFKGVSFECSGDFTRPPKAMNDASMDLFKQWNAARQSLGFEQVNLRDTGGSSDGNLLAFNGLPHLDGVGVRGGSIHSSEEFAIVSSLEMQIQTVLAFMKALKENQ